MTLVLALLNLLCFIGHRVHRSIWDMTIITSVVYLIVAIILVILHRSFNLIVLNLLCFIGSTLYHYYAESRYFNFDNIFATTQAFIYLWTIIVAISLGDYEVIFTGVLGLGIASYLLISCGMPSLLLFEKEDNKNNCICRNMNPKYGFLHSTWHIISAGGPLLSSWYFSSLSMSNYDNIIGLDEEIHLFGILNIPIVSAVSLCLSICMNIQGNIMGIMPLD